MTGYAKIRVASSTTKSRSMDFSDLISLPQNPKSTTNTRPNPNSKAQEIKQITTTTTNTQDSFSDQEDHHEEEAANGKMFGHEVLKRNSSVSSSSVAASAVKWAFSMRRSSSVSERYCRIHDQSVTLAPSSSSPPPFIDDDDDDEVKMDKMQTRSMKKKHRTSKILKAYISQGKKEYRFGF